MLGKEAHNGVRERAASSGEHMASGGKADELSVFDALRDVLCARVRPEQVVSRTDGERWRAYLLVRGGPEGCGRLSIRA